MCFCMLEMTAPLEGIKVLDFTVYQNGPSATAQLRDQGATVCKVEPLKGEPMRFLAGRNFNMAFEDFNKGKLSVSESKLSVSAHTSS